MPPYPFDDFARDFDALHDGGQLIRNDWMANVFQVREYMQRTYPAADWQFRCQRFVLVMMYLSDHVHDFDTGDYGVFGSERAGALVGEHVLRAAHEVFTKEQIGPDPTPQEIMRLADKYR